MYYTVKEVKPLENYRLDLKFEDGPRKICDLSDHLEFGVFKAFKDVNFFNRARVYCGTVIWSEKLDIAPEYLYEHGREITGEH